MTFEYITDEEIEEKYSDNRFDMIKIKRTYDRKVFVGRIK